MTWQKDKQEDTSPWFGAEDEDGVHLSAKVLPEPSTAELAGTRRVVSPRDSNKSPQLANASGSESAHQPPRNGLTEGWAVVLTSTKHGIKEFDVRVKEDTGTPANWIHPDIVRRCKLDSQVEACSPRTFVDMHGKNRTYEKCVKVTWMGRERNTFEEVFLVSKPKAPIEIALGHKFVEEYGRVGEVCADERKTQDARMFVPTKLTKKQREQMEENRAAHKKQSAQVIAQSQGKPGGSSGGHKNGESSKKGKKLDHP